MEKQSKVNDENVSSERKTDCREIPPHQNEQGTKRARDRASTSTNSNSPPRKRRAISIASLVNDEDVDVRPRTSNEFNRINYTIRTTREEIHPHYHNHSHSSLPFTAHHGTNDLSNWNRFNNYVIPNVTESIQVGIQRVNEHFPDARNSSIVVQTPLDHFLSRDEIPNSDLRVVPAANEEPFVPPSYQVLASLSNEIEPVQTELETGVDPETRLTTGNQEDGNNNETFHPPSRPRGKRKKHLCSECGIGFDQKGGLKQHKKAVHNKIKDCRCPYDDCVKSYATMGDLNRHKKSVHEGKRPFVCSCQNRYTRKISLDRHIRDHNCGPPLEG